MQGPLGDFLNKFKKIAADRDFEKLVVKESAEALLGITLSNENFSIKEGIVSVKGGAALKNSIFMKKREILARANERLAQKLSDIR